MTGRFTLVLACFLAAASAELVQFEPCDDPDGSVQCDVQNVNINPCAEAESGEPCRIRKGNSAAITFDFTPGVSATELESKAYWVGAMGSLPWIGMETNACLFTSCPVTAGQVAHYNYTLKVSKKYSARVYKVQWRLWDEEETMKCCFATRIKLV